MANLRARKGTVKGIHGKMDVDSSAERQNLIDGQRSQERATKQPNSIGLGRSMPDFSRKEFVRRNTGGRHVKANGCADGKVSSAQDPDPAH